MELLVVSGPDTGKQVEISGARSIGRDLANDLVLSQGFVSGRHALVCAGADGSLEVTDLSSKNGTWVDGVRVTGPTTVEEGSIIQIGQNTLQLISKPSAQGRSSPTPEPNRAAPQFHQQPAPSAIYDAGPVAGRDVSISGKQAAGRDLHYHEGLQIKSRMSRRARRYLKWGIFWFVFGTFVSFGGFAFFGSEGLRFINEVSDLEPGNFEGPEYNGTRIAIGIGTFFTGMVVSFVGLVLIAVSLIMRREKIRQPA